MTAKQQAIEAIKRLPEKASFKTIAYEVELLAAIREADEDIKKGRVVPIEKVRRMIPKWISRSSSRKAPRATLSK
jgi:predicted transcriptional regulator